MESATLALNSNHKISGRRRRRQSVTKARHRGETRNAGRARELRIDKTMDSIEYRDIDTWMFANEVTTEFASGLQCNWCSVARNKDTPSDE